MSDALDADLSPLASTTVRDRESAPDAIVVGAGHNGLVAANLWRTRGGTSSSARRTECRRSCADGEVTAAGFRTDLFGAFYPLGIASPVLAGLNLDRHGLQSNHAPAVLAHVFPDDRRCPPSGPPSHH